MYSRESKDTIYCDLSKTSDTVSHISLMKLHGYGVGETTIVLQQNRSRDGIEREIVSGRSFTFE